MRVQQFSSGATRRAHSSGQLTLSTSTLLLYVVGKSTKASTGIMKVSSIEIHIIVKHGGKSRTKIAEAEPGVEERGVWCH